VTFLLTEAQLRASRGAKWHRHGDAVLPAWVADMDFSVADPVRESIQDLLGRHALGYPRRLPEDGVEAAFARRMCSRFGWRPDPELCLPTGDLVQATCALLMAFSDPDDGVVLETPVYPPFLTAVAATGRRLVADPGDADSSTRVLVLCNPHNPSGRVLRRPELEAIAALAADRDLVVIADEIHCDIVYPGHRHIPFASIGPQAAERTVTINSATKGFNIAGLQCGVMQFGSASLLERFRSRIPDRLLGRVNRAGVAATVAAWDHGQEWLDAVLEQLTANRDRVAAWARERAPRIGHEPPEGTYLAWFDCRSLSLRHPTAQEHFLVEAKVGLSPGEDFGPGGEGFVRLNFATSPEILERILNRMDAAIPS
jgi:cystathionine beta-lyase